ncbi:MAG TPA: Rieske 2Fe-2S domain-containing protein, partial [Terriglobales bacterium]|nr:Rieske 2Fe-2S domain-containing protein [Terriglobales bacterium]
MLSAEQNRALTEVGPGTPMGALLRRYWMPIAAVAELEETPTKAVRLLGEDLVLYRDKRGVYGLLDRHCAHRRADLSYGIVEECGLRCNYHGWMYDESGACLAQPFEEIARPEARFKDKVRVKAYRAEAKAGLVWAYLGPEPAPLVPTWEPFTWGNGFVQVVFAEVPCNWLQAQENSIDPVHFEWLHGNWSRALRGAGGPKPPTHLKIAFDEFEYGFTYRRMLEGQPEDSELWTIGRTCLWPNCLFTGAHFEWRVPVDDTHMLSVGWFFDRVPIEMEPYKQDRIPYWYGPIKDPATG